MPARKAADGIEIERPIPLTTEVVGHGDRSSTVVVPRSRTKGLERAMNVVIASIALVVASPVMVLFALLVKLTSPGPIFYSQPRVGIDRRRSPREPGDYDRRARDLGGLPFMIYKFRTMHVGAEPGNREGHRL